jgi:hypothetical protein
LKNNKQFNYTTLFYTNILEQKHNKIVFNKIIDSTFNFEATNIHHHSCPSSYKLPNDSSKIVGLHTTIPIKQDMVVELCARNYATYDGLVNGIDGIFKTSTSYHNKTIVWILFANPKIRIFLMLAKKKSTHLYTNNIKPNWTPIEPIIKNIKKWKKSISSYNKNLISNSISSSKNHLLITRIIVR